MAAVGPLLLRSEGVTGTLTPPEFLFSNPWGEVMSNNGRQVLRDALADLTTAKNRLFLTGTGVPIDSQDKRLLRSLVEARKIISEKLDIEEFEFKQQTPGD